MSPAGEGAEFVDLDVHPGYAFRCEACGRPPVPDECSHADPCSALPNPCAGAGTGRCEGLEAIVKHDHEYDEWWCGPCWDRYDDDDTAPAYDVVHVRGAR